MKDAKQLDHGYRFTPTIISHAVWLYHRFCLSLRDVEDLLAERGIVVSYESIPQWCNRFGPEYAQKLKKRQGRLGDTLYLGEVFIKIRGELHYLWRAIDQDGDTIDILVQKRRNKAAAKRFFRKLLKGQNSPPWRMITDKLKSYSAAHREVLPSVPHSTAQYENNRAEVSHEPTRQRERQMRRFKSAGQAQRFLTVAYKKNKHPFHPGPAAALTANDPPGNRSIAANGPEFHSRRCKHAHFFSAVGSIPAIRHDESLPRRCERSI